VKNHEAIGQKVTQFPKSDRFEQSFMWNVDRKK